MLREKKIRFHPCNPRLQIQAMRNTDYMIYMKTKSGRTWSYRKEKNDWSQTASTGIVRQCSGDQLLSHLLPPLAGDQPGLTVTVENKNNKVVRRFRRLAPITKTKDPKKKSV